MFAGQCTSCHHVDGMNDPSDLEDGDEPAEAELKTFVYPKIINQASGAAPNLTHLMSRSTFAGAKFDLRNDTDGVQGARLGVGADRARASRSA